MDNIKFSRPVEETVSSFHLSHVRSLIKDPGRWGGATNKVPANADASLWDRAAGQVMVTLPGGRVSWAVAFEALTRDEVPSRRLTHGLLDGVTYWFRCSAAQGRYDDLPCYRAYFRHDGTWFFFYTRGAALPFGALVGFSKTTGRSTLDFARAA
jgi:hypothetical protein